MDDLLQKWSRLHLGWRLYSVGAALLCVSIWSIYGFSIACAAAGIAAMFGAFCWWVAS